MANRRFILNANFLLTLNHTVVLVLCPEQVVELGLAEEFCRAVLSNQEQSWFSHRLGWWQEFTFFLDVLAFWDPWRPGLFVINALDHLVQVKRHRELLSRVAICINHEVIAFFVLGPHSALIKVASIYS